MKFTSNWGCGGENRYTRIAQVLLKQTGLNMLEVVAHILIMHLMPPQAVRYGEVPDNEWANGFKPFDY